LKNTKTAKRKSGNRTGCELGCGEWDGRTAHAAVAEAGCEDFVALFVEDAGGGVEEEEGAVAGDEAEFVDGREVVEAPAADSGSIRTRKGSVLNASRRNEETVKIG